MSVAALVGAVVFAPRSIRAESPPVRWCAPEIEALSDGVCAFSPSPAVEPVAAKPTVAKPSAAKPTAAEPTAVEQTAAEPTASQPTAGKPRSLVIFLHPLVGANSNWQWEQQRLFVRLAKEHGFSVLMPRGRLGIGPKSAPNIYAWPTARKKQDAFENEIIDEWMQAKRSLEQREGRFDRVFVFGFSNGAYYASSLAVRGRLDIDGYGIFAGGSGGKYMRLSAEKTQRRVPIFVGYGTKDPARRDQRDLIAMLKSMGWKMRSRSARVGHTVTEDQLRDALRFLGASDR